MEILKIYEAEQLLIKYGHIKHSKLLNIQNMMGIKEALFFLIKECARIHKGSRINYNSENKQLAEKLHKLIMRKCKKTLGILFLYRQNLGSRSSRHANNKKI